jgi:hypothetical protein
LNGFEKGDEEIITTNVSKGMDRQALATLSTI